MKSGIGQALFYRFYLHFDQESPFELKVCAVKPGKVKVSSGFDILVEHSIAVLDDADIVIIPSADVATPPAIELIEKLQQLNHRQAKIIGLCVGAYVLAYAGLLDGKVVTTHWAYADDFKARFPAVKLDPEPLYIEQDNIITSAGTASGLDCCLYVLRNYVGAQLASDVARKMVTAPYRSGGQQQYIELPLPDKSSDSRISDMMDYVRANLAEQHSIDDMAARCAMSRRHFSRLFRQMLGTSFGQWLTTARLKYAQELLEFSNTNIALITEQAGFTSQENFRKQFKQVFKVSPSQWRQTFKQ